MINPAPYELHGKVALVTGSSKGIGAEIARELASRGADVAVNYGNSADAAQSVVEDIEKFGRKAIAVRADCSKPSEIATLFETAVKHFNHLDIVVSNAGKEGFKHISEITEEDFDTMFGTNCRGQLFAKRISAHSLYAGSKAAVESFARQLANDFGDKKITVNAIAPGGTKTGMLGPVARKYIPNGKGDDMSDEELEQAAAGLSPMNRLGEPQDVAYVVAFLASEAGRWMNGQTLTIGGGAAM
ncbi:MAG: hypothetical protein Q9175_004804 [Cornicularia normoerica]